MFRVRRPKKSISLAEARRALAAAKLAGLTVEAPGASGLKHDKPAEVRIAGKVRALVVYVPRDEWTGDAHLEIHSSGAPLEFAEHLAFAIAEPLDATVFPVKRSVDGRPLAKPRTSLKSLAALPERASRVTSGRTGFSDARYGEDLVRAALPVIATEAPKIIGKPPVSHTLLHRTHMGSTRASIMVESVLDERNKPIRSFVSIIGNWDPRDRELLESLGERIGARFELVDSVAASSKGVTR